jgi:predicted 3-demethylubiquinone-9 3-methyltransferase (glyoxalase superfamily)
VENTNAAFVPNAGRDLREASLKEAIRRSSEFSLARWMTRVGFSRRWTFSFRTPNRGTKWIPQFRSLNNTRQYQQRSDYIQKITPFLWFDNQAEEAAKFYTSVFKNSKVGRILRYDEASAKAAGRPAGSVLTIEFEIGGQKFTALNGGPQFKFNESVSFVVNCKTQEEVDYFWEKLTAGGGQESECGWLKDKFGLSWQVTPTVLIDMLNDKDPKKAERVMKAMMQMQKIEINKLKAAYAGK